MKSDKGKIVVVCDRTERSLCGDFKSSPASLTLSLTGQAITCASIFEENFSASQYNPGALEFFGSKRAGAIQRDPDSDSAKQFGLIKATIKKGVHIGRMYLQAFYAALSNPRSDASAEPPSQTLPTGDL